MPKLSGLGFENFKIFENHHYLDFAPLTILTGQNNSGKSTVINGLKLLAENFDHLKEYDEGNTLLDFRSLLYRPFNVNKIIERYGGLNQFINHNSEDNFFKISIKQKPLLFNSEFDFIYTFQIENNILKTGKISRIEIIDLKSNKKVFDCYETEGNAVDVFSGALMSSKNHVIKIDLVYLYNELINVVVTSMEFLQLVNSYRNEHNVESKEELKKKIDQRFNGYVEWFNGSEGLSPFLTEKSRKYISAKTLNPILTELENKTSIFNLGWYINKYPESLNQSGFEETSDLEKILRFSILKILSNVEWGIAPSSKPNFRFTLNEFFSEFLLDRGESNVQEIQENIEDAIKLSGLKHFDNIGEINFFSEFMENCIRFLSPQVFYGTFKLTKLEEYFFGTYIPDLLKGIISPLVSFKEVVFLDAYRINPKRTFFLNSLELISTQVYQLFKTSPDEFRRGKDFINKWIKQFGIADSIEFIKKENAEDFSIYLNGYGHKKLLADYGFGASQILPICLSLIPRPNELFYMGGLDEPEYLPRTVCIEEPENSLHPALQSKLADMFVEAATLFNIQLIIETHSEYIIRRMQLLIANSNSPLQNKSLPALGSEEVIIYYFTHPNQLKENEEQVIRIKIRNDGMLDKDFGEGFYDEATRTTFEILRLQSMN